jgi:hypothetical protein
MSGKGRAFALLVAYLLICGLGRIERTDGDVISVRISERKLRSSSDRIHTWFFFQPADECARPWQGDLKVVDPKEQQQAVARLGVEGTYQRGMPVGTSLVETEQDRSVRVDDLPEVVVGRSRPPAGQATTGTI